MDYFIVNTLSQNADILSQDLASQIEQKSYTNLPDFIRKGYLVHGHEEEKRFKQRERLYREKQQTEEIEILFIPRYTCNFDCSFCRLPKPDPLIQPLTPKVVEAFYNYLDQEFSWRKKFITLCGGETLMPGELARQELQWIINGAAERKLDISIVSNGYLLNDYLDTLSQVSIREVQVTLEGPRQLHDQLRSHKNGQSTFVRVVEGIDHALERGVPITLRIVVHPDKIDSLRQLAKFALERKWTRHPLFKTHLSRDFQLHICGIDHEQLADRIRMYEQLYMMILDYPEFLEFHRPALSISRFLFEDGALPDPLFDTCSDSLTRWAFDYTGKIYCCSAAVGKKDKQLGTFYPEIKNAFLS